MSQSIRLQRVQTIMAQNSMPELNRVEVFISSSSGIEEALKEIDFVKVRRGGTLKDCPTTESFDFVAENQAGKQVGLKNTGGRWEIAGHGNHIDVKQQARAFADALGAFQTMRRLEALGQCYEVTRTAGAIIIQVG